MRVAATFSLIIILAAVLVQAGYAYNTSVQASGSIDAESTAIDITDGTFNNNAVLSTDEITAQYDGFTASVISDTGAADTVVRVTVTDRTTIASHEVLKFRVSSTIQGVKHSAGFILSVTDTADSTPMVTAADGEIVTGSIGAGTGSGEYQFDLKVTGMKSQPSAKASAAVTQYVMNGTVGIASISGTSYAGREIGSATLEVSDTATDSDLKVTLSTTNFTDLGDSGWIYILSLARDGEGTQYAFSTDGSTWSYTGGSSCLELEKEAAYTAALYLAGTSGTACAYAWEDVPSTDGAVISGGTITFAHSNAN